MAGRKRGHHWLVQVPTALAEALAVGPHKLDVHVVDGADPVIDVLGRSFVVHWSDSPAGGPIVANAEQLRRQARAVARRAVPIIVVPFMSPAGRRACEAAGLSWFDLSGNAGSSPAACE